MPMQFRKLATALVLAEALIVGVHLGTLVAAYGFGHDWLWGLNYLFDVDRERNVPAVFSYVLLLTAATLLALIAWKQPPGAKPRRILWAGLSAVVFYLSADEGFEIHERIGIATSRLLGGGEMTNYAWLVPYALIGLVFVVVYRRFLADLPRHVRTQFLIAAAMYVVGAFGMEFLAGVYVKINHTERALGYDLLSTTEETLEMLGAIWFINALNVHLEKNGAPEPLPRSAASEPEKSASTSA